MDFLLLTECLFENTWNVLVGVEYPGTGVTLGTILVGVFLIGLSLTLIRKIFGGNK